MNQDIRQVIIGKIYKTIAIVGLLLFLFIIAVIYSNGTIDILKVSLLLLCITTYLAFNTYYNYMLYKKDLIEQYDAMCIEIKKPNSLSKYKKIIFYIDTKDGNSTTFTIRKDKSEIFLIDKKYVLYFIKNKPLIHSNLIHISLGQYKD